MLCRQRRGLLSLALLAEQQVNNKGSEEVRRRPSLGSILDASAALDLRPSDRTDERETVTLHVWAGFCLIAVVPADTKRRGAGGGRDAASRCATTWTEIERETRLAHAEHCLLAPCFHSQKCKWASAEPDGDSSASG